jgi:hypothetical protein
VQVNRRQMQNSDTANTQSSPGIKIEARHKRGPLLFQLWVALLVCFTLPWMLYLDTVLDLRTRLLFSVVILGGSFFALIAWDDCPKRRSLRAAYDLCGIHCPELPAFFGVSPRR